MTNVVQIKVDFVDPDREPEVFDRVESTTLPKHAIGPSGCLTITYEDDDVGECEIVYAAGVWSTMKVS